MFIRAFNAVPGCACVLFALAPLSVHSQPVRADNDALRAVAPRPLTSETIVRNRRFVIESWSHNLADTRITDLTGREVSAVLAPHAEHRGISLALPTEPFVMKPKGVSTVTLAARGETVLPGGLVLPLSPAPDGGGPAKAAWFRLAVSASPRPAPWQNDAASYVTLIKFAVRPSDGAPGTLQLPEPVEVSLDLDGMSGPAIPPFTIAESGLAHEKAFALHFIPSVKQPKLRIRSTISDSDVVIEALPRLAVVPDRDVILGFGLEAVTITVVRLGADAQPDTAATDTTVDLQVEGAARAAANSETIPAGSARTKFTVRSSGLGTFQATVTSGVLSATATVQQRFPVGQLLAACLGGALGGYSRRWVKGARRHAAGRRVAEGTVVAVVAFVAAVLGVGYLNLPEAVVATEAGAFLTGALCGFAGVMVLSKLTPASSQP